MKKKIIIGVYMLTLLILGFTVDKGDGTAVFRIVAFPFLICGKLLRSLSLASTLGNVIAWVLYGVLSLLPLLYLFLLRSKKKADFVDGVMLPIMTLIIFLVLYFYTNPVILKEMYVLFTKGGWIEKYELIFLSGFSNLFYLYLVLYASIKMIRNHQMNYSLLFSRFISVVLTGQLFIICFVVPSRINSYNGDLNLGLQQALHVLRQLDLAIRSGLYLVALVVFRKICIQSSEFSETLVLDTRKFQSIIKITIIYLISSILFFTIYQIVFSSKLKVVSFSLNIPLFEILIFFLSLFLTTSFIKSLELSEESKLTI